MSLSYRKAGVDVEAGYKSVELIKGLAGSTFRKEVLNGLGGFGALFSISAAKDMEDPVLVSGTDGVGTKLKIAFLLDKHDTIGIDCVAMCVDDVVCSGAEPLFFLDYIACGRNIPNKIEAIVDGVARGCKMSGAALIGGETAEMPGFYAESEYDLAGFCVGLVDRAHCIDGSTVKPGDAIIGLASSGIHSNGFSLVRHVMRLNENTLKEHVQVLGAALGDELIRPTRIYSKSILALKQKFQIKAISHITGGGFYENIPRMLPDGLGVSIRKGSWPVLPIFNLIQSTGKIDEAEMYNVFNMGIGMMLAMAPEDADEAVRELNSMGEHAYIIGEAVSEAGVTLC
jgi:phosphoribosylformylglycinamidine cyclo-ligase